MNTSAEISYEQKVEANRVAPVPPGARLHRSVRWKDAEGRAFKAIVPMGMQVAENLKAFYWAERATISGLIAAGATLSDFVVVNDDQILAVSRVEPDDDADDIAWLSCLFMETMQGTLGFATPEEIDCSNIKGAFFVPLGAAND
jgi:hypothetical protein